MIKAVLFDFFGVLYPDIYWGMANIFLPNRSQNQQQQLHELLKKADLNEINQDTFWERTAELFGVSIQKLEKERNTFAGVDLVLLDRIRILKKNGIKTGIISNVGSGFVESVIPTKDIKKLFDVLVLSGDTGFIKPDSQVYEVAIEKLGVGANECLFFDDIPRNVRGAQAIGMQAVHYGGLPDFDVAISKLLPDMNN